MDSATRNRHRDQLQNYRCVYMRITKRMDDSNDLLEDNPVVIKKSLKMDFHIVKMYKDKWSKTKCQKYFFINVWRKNVFDIHFTEFGAVMKTVLPVLFKYFYKYCYSDSRKLWAVMKGEVWRFKIWFNPPFL